MILRVTRFARLEAAAPSAARRPVLGRAAASQAPSLGEEAAVIRQRARQHGMREVPTEELGRRSEICGACSWLQEGHCTHPGCPHCFRHPTLTEPWRTVRRCPAGKWGAEKVSGVA